MIITRKIIIGACVVCAVGTNIPSMAQNRVVTQHATGTVVEGGVTMLVTQETTTRYRRTLLRECRKLNWDIHPE